MLTHILSRRERDDGDQIPLFAPSEKILLLENRANEGGAAYFSMTPSPESDTLDATTLGAATELLEGLIDELSATEASDLMREDDSVDPKRKGRYVFSDIGEAASFNVARPPDPHEVCWFGNQSPRARPTLAPHDFSGRKLLNPIGLRLFDARLYLGESMLKLQHHR